MIPQQKPEKIHRPPQAFSNAFLVGFRKIAKGFLAKIIQSQLRHSEIRTLLLALLVEHEPEAQFTLSAGEVARRTGISRRAAERAIRALVNARFLRLVTKKGGRRGNLYTVMRDGVNTFNTDMGDGAYTVTGAAKNALNTVTGDGPSKNTEEHRTAEEETSDRSNAVWGAWIDANVSAGRPRPIRTKADDTAAQRLAALVAGGELPLDALREFMRRYLDDTHDPWLQKNGHALGWLEPRLNRYLAGPVDIYDDPALPPELIDDLERCANER